MPSLRAALLAASVATCLLPVAPAGADHTGGFTPPPPPRRPGHTVQHPAAAPVLQPTPLLGPRVRVRRTVAAGAPVLLPAVSGRVRIVCSGAAMRGASMWLERDAQGRTAVRRHDGGRVYDFTYRVARGGVSTARETCP